ncbi:hypothetical protein H696_00750 [Fonticula alba]|uniref:ABC transporter domain-containing protein n=1 Tax=Fonticula alba TaxID=691883 RepID=A0A058ZGZ5_FONAL|nr:hypothetical protein H696_00750 [Fonticula alba]KCV73208.1 hypothetical protein H696_00750 [Fonticula alba]|eukprot:XP_009492909.1 hypothetical protein H696_00750 [Fonticula alba]
MLLLPAPADRIHGPAPIHHPLGLQVENVMNLLGLRHIANTPVGSGSAGPVRGVSGGERRRVSIAAQLISDPSILFLDEPTTGLDCFTAHHLLRTLTDLTRKGKTVIFTIHQPRSEVFAILENVMLMSQFLEMFYPNAVKNFAYNWIGVSGFLVVISAIAVFLVAFDRTRVTS